MISGDPPLWTCQLLFPGILPGLIKCKRQLQQVIAARKPQIIWLNVGVVRYHIKQEQQPSQIKKRPVVAHRLGLNPVNKMNISLMPPGFSPGLRMGGWTLKEWRGGSTYGPQLSPIGGSGEGWMLEGLTELLAPSPAGRKWGRSWIILGYLPSDFAPD